MSTGFKAGPGSGEHPPTQSARAHKQKSWSHTQANHPGPGCPLVGTGHLHPGHVLTEAAGRCEWLATSLHQHPGWGLLSRLPPDVAATKPAVVGSTPQWGRERKHNSQNGVVGNRRQRACSQGTCVNRALTLTRSLLDPRMWGHWKPARGGRRAPHAAVTQE